MKLRYFCVAMIFTAVWKTAPAAGAVQLASLINPTVQTLINLGPTGVAVGPYDFSNFAYVDASSGVLHTAAQVQVMPFSTTGYGLQFVSNWFAADGSLIDDVISYDVTTSDPSRSIGRINLFSNGTAPVPAAGTFTSASLASQLLNGVNAAALLSTFNDGFTAPVDSTKPDQNFASTALSPQNQLHITDTYVGISTTASAGSVGGVTTASILQNAFVPIPEPAQTGWYLMLPIAVAPGFVRPRRRVIA